MINEERNDAARRRRSGVTKARSIQIYERLPSGIAAI